MLGLVGPQPSKTEIFGRAGSLVYLFEVVTFRSERGVEIHGLLRDQEQFARGLAACEVAVGLLYVG